jgi:hypothetical protein
MSWLFPSLEGHWSAAVVRLEPELAGDVDLEIRSLPSTSAYGEHLRELSFFSSTSCAI